MEAVNSRLPPRRARSTGMAASVVTSTLRQLRSIASAKSAMSIPSSAAGPGWPTWFQTKSRLPNSATVRATISLAKASCVRSPASATALPPAARISAATASARAASRSTTETEAPSLANRSAPARPMPDAPAVTIPILPASRIASPFLGLSGEHSPPHSAHVALDHPWVRRHVARGPVEHQLAGRHHVGVVRVPQHLAGVLLDLQDRHAVAMQLG